MNDTLLYLFYKLIYLIGYLEIMMNKIFNNRIESNNDFQRVLLISIKENLSEYVYEIDDDICHHLFCIKENLSEYVYEIDDDICMNYDFGIVERTIGTKKCHFLFEELDTDDIDNMFEAPIGSQFFTIEVQYQNKSYSLDVKDINYSFVNNKIFFSDHVIYLMRKNYDILVEEYSLMIIDNNCDMITLNENQYIQLCEHGYDILNKPVQ